MPEITRESVLKTMEDAADRMGLDLEDLQEMIVEVLEDSSIKANKLKEAIDDGDVASVELIAHDIKGSCANYGLETISQLANVIEKNSKNPPAGAIEELIEQCRIVSGFNLGETD